VEYLSSDEKASNILVFEKKKQEKSGKGEKKSGTAKKEKQLNIGIIIFGFIFIYLVATVVMYITAPHITVYEVRKGSILKDTAYTGLAIRDEIVVQSTESGYINYFAQDNSKVKKGSNIYTLTKEQLNFTEDTSGNKAALTSEEKRGLSLKIQEFIYDYEETNFSESYNLKEDLKSSLGNLSSQTKLMQLDSMISQGSISGGNVYSTADDGIVVYSVDGLENLTLDTATASHLDKSAYHKTEFANNTKIKSGDAVYKIITDDSWTLMLELEEETAEVLKESTYVKVNFTKDNQTMWADFQLKNVDGHHLAYLTFQNAMVRYATERYLDVELILEDKTGLKIPKTAETEKEFYVVPLDFISQGGGDSTGNSVLVKTTDKDHNGIAKHMSVNIYYKNEEEQIVYLDPNQFDDDTVLLKENSNDTFAFSEKRTLKGVYCINKGYAVFKQIKILCESDTYYIVEEGSTYGLSNYDHIALDSTNIQENDVVF